MKLGFWSGWGKPISLNVGATGGAGDTIAPTVTITSTETSPSPALPIPIAFTLSEISTDFAVGDLTLVGCTVANFSGSGIAYTCEATPSTPNGTFTIDIAANAFHDAAGNGNVAATQFSFTSSAFQIADEFTTDRAAGAINGTNAEPTGGARTVVDANSRMTIASGRLTLGGGAAAAGDGILYGAIAIARSLGKTLIFTIPTGSAWGNGNGKFGLLRTASLSAQYAAAFSFAGANNWASFNNLIGADFLNSLSGVPLQFAIMLRAAGAKFFYKLSGGVWRLAFVAKTDTTATVYLGYKLSANTYTQTIDQLRVVTNLLTVNPLVSDSFNRSNGALGTANGAGSEETAPTSTWTDQIGTWAVASNAAACSATSGGVGVATLPHGTINVMVEVEVTRSAGVAGVVLRYLDSSNYIIAYHDGTNVKLDKVVAGVTTNVISAVTTYSAGARLMVSSDATKFRVWYNNSLVGSEGTISDADLQIGTAHGLYTTDTGNTFDNFAGWARGNGSEYETVFNKYLNP